MATDMQATAQAQNESSGTGNSSVIAPRPSELVATEESVENHPGNKLRLQPSYSALAAQENPGLVVDVETGQGKLFPRRSHLQQASIVRDSIGIGFLEFLP
jgi:hypothetical protein